MEWPTLCLTASLMNSLSLYTLCWLTSEFFPVRSQKPTVGGGTSGPLTPRPPLVYEAIASLLNSTAQTNPPFLFLFLSVLLRWWTRRKLAVTDGAPCGRPDSSLCMDRSTDRKGEGMWHILSTPAGVAP